VTGLHWIHNQCETTVHLSVTTDIKMVQYARGPADMQRVPLYRKASDAYIPTVSGDGNSILDTVSQHFADYTVSRRGIFVHDKVRVLSGFNTSDLNTLSRPQRVLVIVGGIKEVADGQISVVVSHRDGICSAGNL